MAGAPIVWTCPLCHEPLHATAKSLACNNRHNYDRAREGYVNLLLAHQKRRPNPGDSAQMLQSRRQFLDSGWYQPLADALVDLLSQRAPGRLLDAGCGEGYYLAYLAQRLKEWRCAGLDISREGVRMAARRNIVDVELAVASSKRIPLADKHLQAVVSVFAPADPAEIRRLLLPGGSWVQVVPGPKHLLELKRLIYSEPRLHKQPDVPAGFGLAERRCVNFSMSLSPSDLFEGLLAMTPLAYKITPAIKQLLVAQTSISIQADFIIQHLEPCRD